MSPKESTLRPRTIILPAILITAGIISVAKTRPPTTGEQFLIAIEHTHPRLGEALFVMDYAPDPAAVDAAARQITDRGHGDPGGYGVAIPSDHEWIKTFDATFTWASAPLEIRQSLQAASATLSVALAHTQFDDVATDQAVASGLSALDAQNDEALLLAWANADRGMLAEATDRPAAAREALLLLARDNPGPILACAIAGNHLYILPEPSTPDAAWCELQCFNPSGALEWTGVLHVVHHRGAENVRTLAVMFAKQALTKALDHTQRD